MTGTAAPGSENRTVLSIRPDGTSDAHRALPVETPVALEYNGIAYAVMMATPQDLTDYAIGFSLSERIALSPSDILDVVPHQTTNGVLLKIRIRPECMQQVVARVRNRLSEGSCGLCGLESLEEVVRPLPPVTAKVETTATALFAALDNLRDHQPLNAATGGVHAAAFCSLADGRIILAREDVGRHNALDKLIGALSQSGASPDTGFLLVSSRCSYELVEKAGHWGCPLLVSISTATSLAVDRAQQCGLGLVALARRDAMLAMTTHANAMIRTLPEAE